ncbi:MAG: hypothetical protein JW900_01615 [Anaerolineae bacterium]|nr:hypothetical protein [Anaerolineae bacterium]
MKKSTRGISRRQFLVSAGAALAGAAIACGQEEQPGAPTAAPTGAQPAATSTLTPLPSITRPITANDFTPEQRNVVETIVVLANFAGRPERVLDLRPHWHKIFGTEDPLTQLNGYYQVNFYGQLELQPVSTPEVGEKGYVEVELPGLPQDYAFGWLIGLESDEIDSVDPAAVRRLILEVMARVLEHDPALGYQDRFILMVLNASGAEYGRGAAGFLPTTGVDPLYELFVGDLAEGEAEAFADETHFRVVDGARVVGLIDSTGYTFDDYFRDRQAHVAADQFIRGMACFSRDAPLSCASHDVLHGLRRQSAYANPPEGRVRALNCLYNLPLQSLWLVGTPEHGPFDRSVNCSPYIGWWDPMGDHLHPTMPRDFFCGHPHGMCAFSKLRMGLIPARCVASVDADDVTLRLAPLSAPTLPAAGSDAEAIVARVPLLPGNDTVAHIYLLLEYRCRFGGPEGRYPDNFTIDPDDVFGDKIFDPGYDAANPANSHYVNPPTVFVPDEGVLVYLVNERMPELPAIPYSEWYNFVLALLNPAGNEQREDLNQAALDAGESITVDFANLYADRGLPIRITVAVTERTAAYAAVRITRER